jgi:hypothetical protein
MATKSYLTQPQIFILTERNYDSWFIRMRTIMCSQYLWDFVIVGYPDPIDQATEMTLTNVE